MFGDIIVILGRDSFAGINLQKSIFLRAAIRPKKFDDIRYTVFEKSSIETSLKFGKKSLTFEIS